jgi:hypothetical protein
MKLFLIAAVLVAAVPAYAYDTANLPTIIPGVIRAASPTTKGSIGGPKITPRDDVKLDATPSSIYPVPVHPGQGRLAPLIWR